MTNEQTTSPTIDPGATSTAPVQSDLIASVNAASDKAVEQHLAETKRGSGKRGPDKKPRKPRVSVGEMVNSSDEALLAGDPANVYSTDFQAQQPPVDEETVRALAEGAAGLLEDLGSGWLRAQVLKSTGDVKLADEAAKGGKMSETTKNMITLGAVQCAKKYITSMEYAPEVTLAGGFMVYTFGVWKQARTFCQDLAKLRAQAQ